MTKLSALRSVALFIASGVIAVSCSASAPTSSTPSLPVAPAVDLGVDMAITVDDSTVTAISSGGTSSTVIDGTVDTLTGTPGATALITGHDTNGVIQRLGIAPKFDGETAVAPKLDADSTAASLFVMQLGEAGTNPAIGLIAIGMIAELDEFAALSDAIETSNTPLDDPDVADRLAELIDAADTAADALDPTPEVQGFAGSQDHTSFNGQECEQTPSAGNAIEISLGEAADTCLDMARIDANGDGTYRLGLSGRNLTPRWGVFVDHSDKDRVLGLMSPQVTTLPGIVDAALDIIELAPEVVMHRLGFAGCSIIRWGVEAFGGEKSCVDRNKITEMVEGYTPDGRFIVSATLTPGPHDIAVYAGYPFDGSYTSNFDGRSHDAPPSVVTFAQVFTTFSVIVAPVVGLVSDARSIPTSSADASIFKEWESFAAATAGVSAFSVENLESLTRPGANKKPAYEAFSQAIFELFLQNEAGILVRLFFSDDWAKQFMGEGLAAMAAGTPILKAAKFGGDLGLSFEELFANMANLANTDIFPTALVVRDVVIPSAVSTTTTTPPAATTTTTAAPKTTTTTTTTTVAGAPEAFPDRPANPVDTAGRVTLPPGSMWEVSLVSDVIGATFPVVVYYRKTADDQMDQYVFVLADPDRPRLISLNGYQSTIGGYGDIFFDADVDGVLGSYYPTCDPSCAEGGVVRYDVIFDNDALFDDPLYFGDSDVTQTSGS